MVHAECLNPYTAMLRTLSLNETGKSPQDALRVLGRQRILTLFEVSAGLNRRSMFAISLGRPCCRFNDTCLHFTEVAALVPGRILSSLPRQGQASWGSNAAMGMAWAASFLPLTVTAGIWLPELLGLLPTV